MASAGMPEFISLWDLVYTEGILRFDLVNDEAAENYFLKLIKESVNEKYRILDNLIHNCIHA